MRERSTHDGCIYIYDELPLSWCSGGCVSRKAVAAGVSPAKSCSFALYTAMTKWLRHTSKRGNWTLSIRQPIFDDMMANEQSRKGISEIEGKAARVAQSEPSRGNERDRRSSLWG